MSSSFKYANYDDPLEEVEAGYDFTQTNHWNSSFRVADLAAKIRSDQYSFCYKNFGPFVGPFVFGRILQEGPERIACR